MAEIQCPKCGEIFTIEQSNYDELLQHVRNDEFTKEIAAIRAEIEGRSKNEIAAIRAEQKLSSQQIMERHDEEIKIRDAEIERLKNYRLSMSTKGLGENLELFCANEFEQLRSLAFKNAEFGKDNDSKTSGTKGDYIFRDYTDGHVEYISIMFEMKNEADETATKHKNSDFFKKLDKDRTDKGCEYAVLVSMLEQDSELYNRGIVDVSHEYPKMYVIRPQFFIPMITLLRNAAMSTMETKSELAEIQQRNIDITNFEDALNDFRKKCANNYDLAGRKFTSAIDEIDKVIRELEKVKADLEGSLDNLRLASDKADKLTIRKLTAKSPTLKEEFDKLKN